MNNNEKYQSLRRQYPVFEYVAYHYREEADGLHLWFDFRMGDVEFHPTALIERRPFLDFSKDIDVIVFNIGMVELVSYWKCACPPMVKVLCGSLTDEQIAFWRKLYWNGLGEFYYTNGIVETPEAFLEIENGELRIEDLLPYSANSQFSIGNSQLYLVPIGGGKDSVVTFELLRRAGKAVRPLIMNPRGATVECAAKAGFPIDEVLVIRRTIDHTLLDLNAKGYLNGHTPFSAMLAFYTQLASALSGIPNVALSNESSANESTVLGTNVNHQYSKSLEFEDDFRSYVPGFNYFSFLRPLSELQIAMLFSRFSAYHDVFRSCNVGSKQDIWCGHCAKCLFAYIILSPFIEPARLNAIFGKSMLDDVTLRTEFLQLLGKAETKPFECVGTVSEVNTALSMAIERWYPTARPQLLADYVPMPSASRVSLHGLLPEGNLNADERNILLQCIENNN
ncbi:MAG: hypothetical protein K6F72_04090 [Bacteroidales bacterium]|nr:hypothetical protein [Bacteroidales bacterium]